MPRRIKEKMSNLTRREARETLLALLFESEFRADEDYREIYATSAEERQIPEDEYVKSSFYRIFECREEIDGVIGNHAKGWKTSRLSKLSRSVLRLGVCEMLYAKEIPYSVTINEAVELTKKFDEPRARSFVNGVLNAVKDELVAAGKIKQ